MIRILHSIWEHHNFVCPHLHDLLIDPLPVETSVASVVGILTMLRMYACCPLSFWELYSNHGIIYAELMGASMSVWIVSYVAGFLAWLQTWLSYHYAIIKINWVRHTTPHQQHCVTVNLGCTYVSAAYSAYCSLQWMPFCLHSTIATASRACAPVGFPWVYRRRYCCTPHEWSWSRDPPISMNQEHSLFYD